ncbi:MAG: hypothetical protein GY847_29545 [Proteobacteria bacterium]|nr:hypothetical protein [Pseudomonadota bacterium]
MLSKPEIETIQNVLKDLEAPFDLIFHPPQEESQLSSELLDTARRIESSVGANLKVHFENDAQLVARPALTLSYQGRGNLHYLTVPGGLEAPPFIEALMGLVRNATGSGQEWEQGLRGLERPAELLVFVASQCPHCPQAAREAVKIALASPKVTTSIIDAQHFPKLAERFQARSVPLTVLDKGFSWTGVVPASELAEQILSRDSVDHQAAAFNSLIEHNRLDEAVQQICAGSGSSHFLAAWKKSITSSRIPLMLVAEEVLEQETGALDGIVPNLVEVLQSEDAALRGDTADLLGRIGHQTAVPGLETLLDDPNPDVAEIAAEAIEEIRDNNGS